MLFSHSHRKVHLISLIFLLCLTSIIVGKALSLSNNVINFILLGGLIAAYLGGIFLVNSKIVLSVYLLTIVNLDYFRLLEEPFNITIDILFTTTIIMLTLIHFTRSRIRWRQTPIQRAFLLYLAVTLICVFLSVDLLISIKRYIRYISYFLLISLILDLGRDKAAIDNLTKCVIYSAVAPCLIGYYAIITQTPSLLGENLQYLYGIEMLRIKSTLSHANTFGLYLGIVIPLTIGLMLRRESGRGFQSNFSLGLLLALVLPMLYLTYSRIGWIVTAMGVFLTLVFQKRWRLLTIFPWALGFIIWRIPGFITRWSDIIDTKQADSLDWRRGLYAFSLRKFIEKPIFGSGPGTFLNYVSYGTGYTQHHLWIGSLVEVGVVGTIALFILLIVVLVHIVKYTRKIPTALNHSTLAILSTFMLATTASDPFCLPSAIIYLWVLIGLVMAEYQLNTQKTLNKKAYT